MKLINLEERPWGRFYIIHEDSSYKLKRIEVDPGGRLSYQYHHKRSEAWTIVEGGGLITLNGEEKNMSKEKQFSFQKGLNTESKIIEKRKWCLLKFKQAPILEKMILLELKTIMIEYR